MKLEDQCKRYIIKRLLNEYCEIFGTRSYGGDALASSCVLCDMNSCRMFHNIRGWSGGAIVLDKLPVPGRLTNLNDSRARAYCAFSGCGWGLFGHFFSRLSFLFSFSLPLGDGPI